MRNYNGINRRGFLRTAMLSGAAMCVSSISNEMVANESRDKQEPLALGSKVAAGISAKRTLGSGTASMVVSAIGFGCMGLRPSIVALLCSTRQRAMVIKRMND